MLQWELLTLLLVKYHTINGLVESILICKIVLKLPDMVKVASGLPTKRAKFITSALKDKHQPVSGLLIFLSTPR
jgi:hypothetical protein